MNRTYRRISYPDAFFSFFPQIRELRLNKGRAMSLPKLNRLVETSRNLRVLDLAETMWTIDPSELNVATSGTLSPYEAQLTQILDKLPKLCEIDLGIWPFPAGPGWFVGQDLPPGRVGLEQWAEQRGVMLKIEGCTRGD